MVDALTKWVNSLTAAAPKSAEMRELVKRHDKWLRTAELNRYYYAPDAYYEWTGPDHAPTLTCYGRVLFDDRSRDRLYTTNGADSLALFHQWGGIVANEPPRPATFTVPQIRGNLRDAAHPERWKIEGVPA